jgi:hypothetical protein
MGKVFGGIRHKCFDFAVRVSEWISKLNRCRFIPWKTLSLALIAGAAWRGKSFLGCVLLAAGVAIGVGPGCNFRRKD